MQDKPLTNDIKYSENEMISMLIRAMENKLYMTSRTENGFKLYTMLGQSFYITCHDITNEVDNYE